MIGLPIRRRDLPGVSLDFQDRLGCPVGFLDYPDYRAAHQGHWVDYQVHSVDCRDHLGHLDCQVHQDYLGYLDRQDC